MPPVQSRAPEHAARCEVARVTATEVGRVLNRRIEIYQDALSVLANEFSGPAGDIARAALQEAKLDP